MKQVENVARGYKAYVFSFHHRKKKKKKLAVN